MSAMWDAFQRETLTALGHVVYRQVDAAVDAQQAQPRVGEAPSSLLHALARAAGVPVEGLSGLPPLDQLRGAAAKRALWPRLRAMRATARS